MKLPIKDIIIAIVVFALAVLAVSSLSGSYDDIQQRATPQPTAEKQVDQEKLDALMVKAKNSFMSECNSDGDLTEYCNCTWNYLTDRHTLGEISNMGFEYQTTGTIADPMWDAIYSCENSGSY